MRGDWQRLRARAVGLHLALVEEDLCVFLLDCLRKTNVERACVCMCICVRLSLGRGADDTAAAGPKPKTNNNPKRPTTEQASEPHDGIQKGRQAPTRQGL